MLASRTLALPYMIVEIVQSMCDSDTTRDAVFNGLAWRSARRSGRFSWGRFDVTPIRLVHTYI